MLQSLDSHTLVYVRAVQLLRSMKGRLTPAALLLLTLFLARGRKDLKYIRRELHRQWAPLSIYLSGLIQVSRDLAGSYLGSMRVRHDMIGVVYLHGYLDKVPQEDEMPAVEPNRCDLALMVGLLGIYMGRTEETACVEMTMVNVGVSTC